MPYAKTHSSADINERNAKPGVYKGKALKSSDAKYRKVDEVITEIYCDICNGRSRTDIIEALCNGEYDTPKKKLSPLSAREYYKRAIARLKENAALKEDEFIAILVSRYETIFEDCMKANDRQNARQTLDSLAKLLGLNKSDKKQIEVNKTDDKITISFGFSKEE